MGRPEPAWERGEYRITCDASAIDRDVVLGFLASSYWAKGTSLELLGRSLDRSLCFSLLKGPDQVGFARVITDYARIAHLADVFVLPPERGDGLGRWLVSCVLAHPDLQHIGRWTLATEDAHGFYEEFGFTPLKEARLYMERTVE